jgi:predicted RNase H-like HicB family nuclease
MEYLVNLHIEKLPEGFYLATSDDIQGLVVQGQTLAETLTIAADVAKQLLQAQTERDASLGLKTITDSFDYPLVVNN